MNDYEKLVEITSNKLSLSKNFLEITKNMQKLAQDNILDSIDLDISKRQDLIDDMILRDEQFVKLFEDLKKTPEFEKDIVNYPKLGEYIQDIKNIFKDVREIDKTIIPAIKTESNNIREKLKKHKESSKVNQKYGFDMMEKTTKDNFGIFFDQKQ